VCRDIGEGEDDDDDDNVERSTQHNVYTANVYANNVSFFYKQNANNKRSSQATRVEHSSQWNEMSETELRKESLGFREERG